MVSVPAARPTSPQCLPDARLPRRMSRDPPTCDPFMPVAATRTASRSLDHAGDPDARVAKERLIGMLKGLFKRGGATA